MSTAVGAFAAIGVWFVLSCVALAAYTLLRHDALGPAYVYCECGERWRIRRFTPWWWGATRLKHHINRRHRGSAMLPRHSAASIWTEQARAARSGPMITRPKPQPAPPPAPKHGGRP